MWTPAWALPAAASGGLLCTVHWLRAKLPPAPIVLHPPSSDARYSIIYSNFVSFPSRDVCSFQHSERASQCPFRGSLKLMVARRQQRAPHAKLFLSCFPADHMTPGCTVCLGPDFRTVPASSGVSVTSTITLLLFHSHEPLCQSSQNQTDGASWQQTACKSWII